MWSFEFIGSRVPLATPPFHLLPIKWRLPKPQNTKHLHCTLGGKVQTHPIVCLVILPCRPSPVLLMRTICAETEESGVRGGVFHVLISSANPNLPPEPFPPTTKHKKCGWVYERCALSLSSLIPFPDIFRNRKWELKSSEIGKVRLKQVLRPEDLDDELRVPRLGWEVLCYEEIA